MKSEDIELKVFVNEWVKRIVDNTWAFPEPMKRYWYSKFEVWLFQMLKEFLKYLKEIKIGEKREK